MLTGTTSPRFGVHTCDKRINKTDIAREHPGWTIEAGFTEVDELWLPDIRETNDEHVVRTREVLNELFATDENTFIGVTGHGGVMSVL